MDTLYTETHGAGPDVVFVHGWGMHSGVWRDFALVLARDFRVTLIDLPGHGRSATISDFGLPGLARALSDVAPERAHWVGWSLGAEIALYLADRYPERVSSLAMVAGNARFASSPDWPHAMDAELLERFATEMMEDHHATLMKFLSLQTMGLENARAALKMLRERVEECDEPAEDALRAGLDILRSADLRPHLARLRRPLLLLMGARDRLVPPAAGSDMLALAQSADLHILEGAAHVPFLTHEEECVNRLAEFWRRHDR